MADNLPKAINDDFLVQEAAFKERVLRDNWVNTADTSPDAFAKKIALSRATQIPIQSLFADPVEAKRHEALSGTDFTGLVKLSPKTTNFLLDQVNAGIFRDEANTLSGMEKALTVLGGTAGRFVLGGTTRLGASLFDKAAVPPDLLSQGLQAVFPEGVLPKKDIFAQMAEGSRAYANRAREAIEFVLPKPTNTVEAGVYSGAQSAGLMVALLPMAAQAQVTRGVAYATQAIAGTMGVLTGAEAYTEARTKGKGALGALQYAIPHGVFEYAFEVAPARVIAEKLAVNTGLLAFTVNLLKQEIPSEMLTTLSQNMNTWVNLNPEKPIKEFLREQPEALAQTFVATLVGGSMQAGAIHGIQKLAGQPEADTAAAQERAQHVIDLFNAAARVVDRGPENLRAFFQSVAPDQTVFIDPERLAEVAAANKLDLATVLPSAAEQIASGEVAGPGVEIPIGELITGLTGTGAEQAVIQHLRTSPDAMTLAEAQSEDTTKTTEFFQQEADRILAEQVDNQAFVAEAQEVRDDLETQLTQAATYSPTVNQSFAKLLGHAYTVLAERLGTTPKAVRDGWTDAKGVKHKGYRISILGKEGAPGQGAVLDQPEAAATLNIGLDVGADDRTQQVPPEEVIAAIEKLGVKVTRQSPIASTYTHEGKEVTENTLVVDLDRELTDDEMLQLATDLKQEAIPQRVGKAGKLHGPKAADWGDFNPEFFKEHDGRAMSEALNQSQITRDAHALVRENSTALIEEYFTKFGNVIDPDKVKRLFPAYAEDKSRANLVHEPSSELAKLIFTEALKRNNGAVVVFTAGGGGSGKSETLTAARGDSAPLTYDSTLSSFASAVAKIDQALASGAPVRIVYANRPAEVAGAFAVKRKRVVPLDVLARAHIGSSDTLRALAEHYRDNPNVAIQVFNNTGDVVKISTGTIADVPTYEYASLYRRLHELANKALADGEISAEKYAALTVSTEDGGRDARSRGTVQQGQPRQNVAGLAARAGVVSGPVAGVHFSKGKRTTLISSAYGTGAKGAEAERLAQATDPRIKQRIAFYVNIGNGITPEQGVGAVAHTAELTNLYDADADALKIWRNGKGDMNTIESAVLDAGFDGYLTRGFGTQGAAVLLGPRVFDVAHVGGRKDVNVPVAPPANIPVMKAAAAALMANRALPFGQMTAAEWEKTLTKADPETAAKIDFTQFDPGKTYYRDDLAGQLWQGGQWYFSQLQTAVEKAPAKVFSTGTAVKQWLAANAGKLGVKQDEVNWTGINDWLDTQGKSPVSRDAVIEFLKGNGVKVTETVLDSNDVVTDTDIEDGARIKQYAVAQDDSGRYTLFDTDTNAEVISGNDRWTIADWINEHTEGNETPRYEQYVLPGGKNYKELLLTLPSERDANYRLQALQSEMDIIRRGRLPEDMAAEENARFDEVLSEYEALKRKRDTEFKSGHFKQPNIIAHIRFNERTDAEGRRVLFIEEIQSDWAQKGKKEGFKPRETKPMSEGEWRSIVNGWKEELAQKWVETLGSLETARDAVENLPYASVANMLGKQEELAELEARQNDEWKAQHNGFVPKAPFVTDTKAWTALALKRMIRYAVDNGFDAVAWTTGEQQAARYDLSKQVRSIAYLKNADGTFHVTAIPIADDVNVELGTHNTVADLEEKVGKDIAQKIANGEGEFTGGDLTVLRGVDLKVGGEGMKGYYDGIVPQVAKKLGTEVRIVKIDSTPEGGVLTFRPANEGGTIRDPNDRAFLLQPGFTITDKMRELVATTGMPLFAGQDNGPKLGSFDPQNLEMRLLADANLSTFLHETAHFFLTVYADAASQPGASQEIIDDVNVLLNWFGITGNEPNVGDEVLAPGPLPAGRTPLEIWNAMTIDQQRPYHEQFAESFEQYLFSGKAPNIEMKNLFQRFASWMKKVYGSLKEFIAGHPGAKLNPEVEAVMERMLATEQEIAAANDQRNYEALFKKAVDAGMTDKQFADYLALSDEQREDAEAMLRTRSLRDMKWLQNQRNKHIAALQAETRAKRAEVLAEVKAELAATPLRRAMRWLKRGEHTAEDGTEIKAAEGHRLQISEVEALFPEGMLGERPDITKLGYGQYGMLAEAGLAPDVVAEMFGFPSGEALVRELISAPKFADEVEALTDQRMLEEYGDLSSPDAMARAADEAIHNAARARMVATELSALATNIGSPAALVKAAKEYARQLIASKTDKTLKPWAFAAAEVRAGKAAVTALRKGDNAVAAREKRTELINHAAVKEAYAAEKEIKAIVDRFKKIVGYSDKHSAVTSRDFATVQATRAILSQIGIGAKGPKANEYLDLVRKYDPIMGDQLQGLIDDIGATQDWRTIPLSDLRSLSENVDNLWFRAKAMREFIIGGQRLSLESVAEEVKAVIVPHIPKDAIGATHAVTESEKRMLGLSGLKSVLARIEIWANRVDNTNGVGPIAKYVVNTVKHAENTFMTQRESILASLEKRILDNKSLFKPGLVDASAELGYVFGKGPSSSGTAELTAALLHIGNASNKEKLLLGRGWATVRQDGSLDTTKWDTFTKRMHDTGVITKAHYDFVQSVWDTFEEIKPQMQAAHKAVLGKFFREITTEKVTTPFGEYAGGYVPALTDRDIVHDQDVRDLDMETLGGISRSLPAPASGMTKERAAGYHRELDLDLTLLPMQLNKALLFAHMAAPVQQVQRLVNTTEVKSAMDAAFPGARKHMVMPWLARAATHRTSLLASEFGDTGRAWTLLRSRTGMARMMGNVTNTLQQYTGAITAAGVLDHPKHLMYAAPALLGIGDLRAEVKAMSPYMATRMASELSAISNNIHDILLNASVLEKSKLWVARHAYFMQQWADVHLSPIVWIAAYNSVKESQPNIAEQDARDYADSVIRRTQGATGPTDISTFEGGHPFAQVFTQFYSWSNMQAQTIWGELAKNFNSSRSTPGKYARAGGIVLSMIMAQAIVAEAIVQAFRGGPDDDDSDGRLIDDWLHNVLVMGPVKFMTGMVPVLGKAFNVVINRFNDKPYDDRISVAPVVSSVEGAASAPASVYRAMFEDGKPSKAIKDVSEIGTLFGLPTAPLARPLSYTADVATGHVAPTSSLDFMRGIMTGTASPGSKQ